MRSPRVRKTELLSTLPREWPDDLLPAIRAQVHASQRKVVVLDDDPTGTQTVHDIPGFTEWSVPVLATGLTDDAPAVYLLTNTRSMLIDQAQAMNREIGRNLVAASQQAQRNFVVVNTPETNTLTVTLHQAGARVIRNDTDMTPNEIVNYSSS